MKLQILNVKEILIVNNQKISTISYNIGDQFASLFLNHVCESDDMPENWDAQQVEYILIIFNEITHQSIHVQLVPDEAEAENELITCYLRLSFQKSEFQKTTVEIDRIVLDYQKFIKDSTYAASILTTEKLAGYIKAIWAQEQRYRLQKGVSK
ncbi:hypothetical protein [Paenibacillus taichungensis]|uniref:hypothetical protein n=1 Tax=Paenibacillus taichungensis TaxID=484184 RepID=UPI0035E0BDF1